MQFHCEIKSAPTGLQGDICRASKCSVGRLPPLFDWASVINSLGGEDFAPVVARELDRYARADHWSAFALGCDAIQLIGSGSVRDRDAARHKASLYANGGFWRSDPTIDQARSRVSQQGTTAVRMSPSDLPDADMRQLIYLDEEVCDRVFLYGRL